MRLMNFWQPCLKIAQSMQFYKQLNSPLRYWVKLWRAQGKRENQVIFALSFALQYKICFLAGCELKLQTLNQILNIIEGILSVLEHSTFQHESVIDFAQHLKFFLLEINEYFAKVLKNEISSCNADQQTSAAVTGKGFDYNWELFSILHLSALNNHLV